MGPATGEEKNSMEKKESLWFPLAVSALSQSKVPPVSPRPPEASTSHRPPLHCRVHAGPCGDPEGAHQVEGLYGGPCAWVHGGVWRGRRTGSHWAVGAEGQVEPGWALALSAQWWEGPLGALYEGMGP